jgi:hypothetical protein
MPPASPFPRTPRPSWPLPTLAISGGVAVLGTILAFTEGGPCVGFVTIPVAVVSWVAVAQLCLAGLRPPVWADYLRALEMLKQNPGSPEIRNLALAIGREYASLSIDFTGKFTYTDAAILDDLAAVCGVGSDSPPVA